MSRVIKFRAWNKDIAEMVYCDNKHYWAFFNSPDSIGYGLYHRNDGHRVLSGEYNPPVMQFTGLCDRNGKEIYEEDVVLDTLTKAIYIVKFGSCPKHGFTGWYAEGININYVTHINNDADEVRNTLIEVIGNIYENKDLLKP